MRLSLGLALEILRNENRIIFHKRLEDIKMYCESAKTKG
jgi:hypothetical protein